jgi:hypothetical protein
MSANSHHLSGTDFSLCSRSALLIFKFAAALLAATLLLAVGLPALRTIAELDALLARVSLDACEIGLAVLHVCGI